MSAMLGYKGEETVRDESTLEKIADLVGVDPSLWRVVLNSTVRGRSQILHFFDIVMESKEGKMLIPIEFIHSNDENISSKIMLHKVKSDDISSYSSYIMTDFPVKARDKMMCDMCHIKVIDVGTLISQNRLNKSFVDAFYRVNETEKKPVPAEKPKLFSRKNRDRTRIVQDVLESVLYMKSASITQLIYKCNLNYKTARSLLNEMITKDLLKLVEYSSIGKRYELTDKGRKSIEKYQFFLNG